MAHCHKWMIFCIAVAGSIALLPWLGWQLSGAGIILALLMVACCIAPVVMMAFASKRADKSECSTSESDKSSEAKPDSCH